MLPILATSRQRPCASQSKIPSSRKRVRRQCCGGTGCARTRTTHILPSKLTANLCDLSRSARESTINRTSSRIIAFRRVRSRFVALNRTYSRNMACARSRWAPKGKGPFGRFQQPLDSQTKHASATPPRGRTVNGDTGVEPPLGRGANRLHVPFPALVSFGVLKEGKASAAQRPGAAPSGLSLG